MKKQSFKTICRHLHLWLGLVSGIFVFIVCVTGGLYVFKDEIEAATEPWRFVKPEQTAVIPPERLISVAGKVSGLRHPIAITYGEAFDAVKVDYQDEAGNGKAVYINPYTGGVIKMVEHRAGDFDFFDFVLDGHLSLWLPREIGGPIVSYAVLVFFIVLVTGLVIWLPRRWNSQIVRNKLWPRHPFRAARMAFDLHNVVGFYTLLPLFVLCLTGMIFGLPWFSRAVYGIVSGGKSMQPYTMPVSDTLKADTTKVASLDKLYTRIRHDAPEATGYYFTIPERASDIYRVSVVHKRNSYYRTDNLYFDRYTLAPLEGTGPWAGRYDKVPAADRLMRMNLEIHDGRIWGIWGKLIMCLAAVVGASLPVTGFLLWRKHSRKRRQ